MGLFHLANGQFLRTVSLGCAVAIVGAVTGCQTFAPAGLGSITAKQREQKIVKQAANDPFPSPGDVGLGERTKTF